MEIKKYEPVIYEGHNSDMSFRVLGFCNLFLAGIQQALDAGYNYSRYRYSCVNGNRLMTRHRISSESYKFFSRSVKYYVIFDLVFKNSKNNTGKSSEYIKWYTCDLLLFHSISTFILPYIFFFNMNQNSLGKYCSLITRRRVPLTLMCACVAAAKVLMIIKISDILTDILLDMTFRKYVYDYKKQFSGFKFERPDYERFLEEQRNNKI
jgi:hypothetical protein